MRKYILYGHDGSKNHGCEALVRSTVQLLDDEKKVILVSKRPDEDIQYGLSQICTVIDKEANRKLNRRSIQFFRAYYYLKCKKDYLPMDFYTSEVAGMVQKGDIALSIGGDTYCYGSTIRLIQDHNKWRYAGLKTVLWGCSMDPDVLNNPDVVADIRNFDLITARESLTYKTLKEINPNTVLVADTAFWLKKNTVKIPAEFQGSQMIGLNVSPLVEEREFEKGIVRANYQCLINKILAETDFKIMLIPHVVWDLVDDRRSLSWLFEKYKDTGRVFMLDDCGCEDLKGYISKCRFFIGARTHATIAAYSTGVPTLVLGYSIKALGIAYDLFGEWEHYVIPAQELRNDDDLMKGFQWIMNHEAHIRSQLKKVMPDYRIRALKGIEELKKLNS